MPSSEDVAIAVWPDRGFRPQSIVITTEDGNQASVRFNRLDNGELEVVVYVYTLRPTQVVVVDEAGRDWRVQP